MFLNRPHDRDQRCVVAFIGVAHSQIQRCLEVAHCRCKLLEVEQILIEQVRGHRVAKRREHRAANMWCLFFQIGNHLLDARPLEIRLRAAEITRNDRKLLALSIISNVRFPAVGERAGRPCHV